MCFSAFSVSSFVHWGEKAPSSAQWSTAECVFSHYLIRLVSSMYLAPLVCDNLYSAFFFSVLLKAGVSVDVRYTHHPAAAAKTADGGASSLQHCDFQSGLSQTGCEGSASFSDYKPSLQPYRNSSKEGLGRRGCFCVVHLFHSWECNMSGTLREFL